MTAWNIKLPVPEINQFVSETSDGRPNENADKDCGPTASAAVTEYNTGVVFLPDEVKDIMWHLAGKPAEGTGITTFLDLQQFLNQRAGLANSVQAVTSTGACMATVRQYLFQGKVLIFLLSDFGGHWIVVDGGDGADSWHTAHVVYMDPNGGMHRTETNSEFWGHLYRQPDGSVAFIAIDSLRNPNLV